jgi:phosphoribosylanthranilate isomerase
MKVQIYSIKTPEDALLCAEEGVDFIGVATGERGRLPAELNFAACRAVFAAIPPGANLWKNAMTIASAADEIIETVRATAPDLVHLCGEIDDYTPAAVGEVRRAIAPVKVLMAIPVRTAADILLAESYAPVSDYFILDTKVAGFAGVGATGQTHDWRISAELVRRVHVPVILAGGLSPENVAEAIRTVMPWGVDSFTHTNIVGAKRKDRARVRAFAAAARAALD